jgi:hypothetical protein
MNENTDFIVATDAEITEESDHTDITRNVIIAGTVVATALAGYVAIKQVKKMIIRRVMKNMADNPDLQQYLADLKAETETETPNTEN